MHPLALVSCKELVGKVCSPPRFLAFLGYRNVFGETLCKLPQNSEERKQISDGLTSGVLCDGVFHSNSGMTPAKLLVLFLGTFE